MTTDLCFNDFTFSPVTHQNNLWIRAVELANALGCAREDTVSRIYQRHADEFTEDMTQVVEISEDRQFGADGRFRIFSLRGCHLIAMFARTPVAKAFRRWVLDVIEQYGERVQAQPVTDCHALPETTTPSTTESRRPLDKLVKVWAQQSRTPHAQCWTMVNTHFNLQSVTELPNEWIPDAIAFVQGRIDALPKALPDAAAAIPPAQTARRKHSPGPVERDIAALIDEIESMYPLKRQFDDALRRLNNTVHPLFTATYGALGWHSHAGYPADALGDALGGAYWDSQRSMQAAFDHAHQFARVFRTLARLHGM